MGGINPKNNVFRKIVDPWGLTGGQNVFGGYTWGGGKGGGSQPKKKQEEEPQQIEAKPDPMLQYLSQMQSQQAAQAEAARRAQQEAVLEAQRQSAAATARQGEMGAQQFLSQAGAMQQAKDVAAAEARQRAYSAAGESAVGGGFDINKIRQEQLANLGGTGTIPSTAKLPFYGTDVANAGVGATGRPVNIFSLPQARDLTFGGK